MAKFSTLSVILVNSLLVSCLIGSVAPLYWAYSAYSQSTSMKLEIARPCNFLSDSDVLQVSLQPGLHNLLDFCQCARLLCWPHYWVCCTLAAFQFAVQFAILLFDVQPGLELLHFSSHDPSALTARFPNACMITASLRIFAGLKSTRM